MNLIYGYFVLMIISIEYQLNQGKTFFVSDYNAYPDDNLDDTNAIQLTVNEAINYGSINDIVFGYGIYTISATILIHNATNLTISGQGMDKTFLIGSKDVAIFSAHFCQGLKLISFSIDYDPLPFTAGYVVNVSDKYLDVEIVSPHQTDVDRQVHGFHRYDPLQMRPAFGPNTYGIYQRPPNDAKTTIVSSGILRLPLSSPLEFVKGDPIVARYVFTNHTIYVVDVTDLTIQSILMYTSWSMGIVSLRVKRFNIIDYHVIPRNGRWLSLNQDCMHFVDTREYIQIYNSTCQSMGDDALNVHATFLLITKIINSTTIIVKATNGTTILDVGIGTNLEFSSNQQPYTVYGNGTIHSLIFNSTNSRIITFTNPINVSINDWICVADTPFLIIKNFTIANNRARGVLLETRNIDIRQSIFNRTSGPAILIQPSMYWYEGPEARNVTLINNIFFENNEGITQENGIITILPNPIQLIPVINDIRIESSTFYFGNSSQGLLQTYNGNNIFLNENYISLKNSLPFILICNSKNITARNNSLIINKTKIDQYYTFNTTYPCSMNLSIFIDLPSSAFNSSFPPPVFTNNLSTLNHQH